MDYGPYETLHIPAEQVRVGDHIEAENGSGQDVTKVHAGHIWVNLRHTWGRGTMVRKYLTGTVIEVRRPYKVRLERWARAEVV